MTDWHQVDGWRWEAVLRHEEGFTAVLQVTPVRGEKDVTQYWAEFSGSEQRAAMALVNHSLETAKERAEQLAVRAFDALLSAQWHGAETRQWEKNGGRNTARRAQLTPWVAPF